jgi:uncharacterized lipoprotein YajG
MKTIFLFIALLTVASCNTSKNFAAFVKDKCADSSITKNENGTYTLSVSCVDLYKTEEVKKYLQEGKVCYDVANAELHVTGVSKDSIPDIFKLLKLISKGAKK